MLNQLVRFKGHALVILMVESWALISDLSPVFPHPGEDNWNREPVDSSK